MSSKSPLPFVSKLAFDPDYLAKFEENVFIEGPLVGRRLTNFFALLFFATIIATYGVTSDSSATVIGAMLIAPLMQPIIATTAAVIMGDAWRARHAFALTVVGVVTVIIIALALTWVIPDASISFTENGEISSRTNPGLYALVTALGAGAAGAFIISRSEISDSIAGVAIAIALVPPLCVVGISLQQRQWDAATGSFLLFLTNYFATLFAGGFVLKLVGIDKPGVKEEQVRLRRIGFRMFTIGTLLLMIPLGLTAYFGIKDLYDDSIATIEVHEWLEGTSYEIISVDKNNAIVNASVEGTGELKSVEELENQIAEALRRPVIVELRVITELKSKTIEP